MIRLKTLKKPSGTSNVKLTDARRCNIEGCERKHYGKGWCNAHYLQHRAGKTPSGQIRPNRKNNATLIRDKDGNKQCVACQLWLPEDRFSTHSATSDGFQVRCRSCVYVARHFTQYQLKPEGIARIMTEQEHQCAICSIDISGRYCVDHDHSCCPGTKSCGKCVRGFLCDGCNLGLGSFQDDPLRMLNAIKYIWRCDLKQDAIEDLRKAAFYIQIEIDRRTREADDAHRNRTG